MRFARTLQLSSCVCALLLAVCSGSGCATFQRPSVFPKPGIDLIRHELRVDMYTVDKETQEETLLETLKFDGMMIIKREASFTNRGGVHQIKFKITSWVAMAFSKVLGDAIVYISSEDVDPPISTITSEQKGKDFPATFAFNVIFDVRLGNKTVFRGHKGRPEGNGFMVVPPDGNRSNSPTITRFEQREIEMEHPTLGLIRFRPVDCNDREGKTLVALTP